MVLSAGKIICKKCLAGTCKIHSEPPRVIKRPSWDEYFMGLAEAVHERVILTSKGYGIIKNDVV